MTETKKHPKHNDFLDHYTNEPNITKAVLKMLGDDLNKSIKLCADSWVDMSKEQYEQIVIDIIMFYLDDELAKWVFKTFKAV